MCGIVLMGCKYPGSRDVDTFENLLFADTFRGPHSTGVHSLFQLVDKGPIITETQKKMMDGPEFIASEFWPMVSEKRVPGTTANSVFIKRPFCMIGHNRWATKGGINDANAHPFTHGHITLVHNGTLRNQSLLPDHQKFEVDSENVAYAMSVWGVDKTIQNLNGAFTLVWHDANEQTVNIIRNSERPFHLARTAAGDWFGASEEAMLKWILLRQKTPVTISESFECEIGVQYIFDVSTGKFLPKENRKHELPTFRSYSVFQGFTSTRSSGWEDDDYDTWWNERTAHHSRTPAPSKGEEKASEALTLATVADNRRMNQLLWDYGVTQRIGEKIKFSATDFQQYPKNSKYGVMEGYLDTKEYVGTRCHGVLQSDYQQFGDYMGIIVQAVVEEGTMYVTISKPQRMKEGEAVPSTKDFNVGEIFQFTIASVDRARYCWTGVAEGGVEVYGDLGNLSLQIGDTWEGRSSVKLDGRHRMTGLILVNRQAVGSLVEGSNVQFRVTNINLGLSTFEGITACNKKISGTTPPEVFLNIGEYWAGEVKFVYLDGTCRVSNISKMKAEKSIDALLQEVIDEIPAEDDEVVRTTATGERFTAKKWKDSQVSDCCACCSPISFDDIEKAVIMSGYTFCKECADDEPPFDTVKPVTKNNDYFECTECKQRKHNANRKNDKTQICNTCEGRRSRLNRQVLSLPKPKVEDTAIGKTVEFTITQLAMGPAFWGKTRTGIAVSGVIAKEAVAGVGEIWIGRIASKYVDDSFRLVDVHKREASDVVRNIKPIKTLANGMTVNKDLWEAKMSKCKMCNSQISWDKADLVTLVGGVPVCDDCVQLVV